MNPGARAPAVVAAEPPSAGPARSLLLALGFTGGYLVLDWMSYIHPMQQFGITPWNPQPALAIALLMRLGQRWMPVVFAAVLAAEWLVRGPPAPWPSTLLVAAVLTLGYAAMARALTGRLAVDPALPSLRDAMRLVVVVAVGALGTGILYVAALLAAGAGPLNQPFTALARFWIGDSVGILVTLPVVLMLTVGTRRAEVAGLLRRPETAVHAALAAAALALVFGSPAAEQVRFFYVLFIPLVLIATRFGLAGASLAVMLIQAAVIATGELAEYQALTVFEFQSLLIALTVIGLFLGVTVDERRRAAEEVRRSMRLAAAGEMTAAIAHELNQPLTAVANYARACQLIARRGAEADRELLAQTLDKMLAEATRAAHVVHRLRDFFRTGTTQLEPVELEPAASRVMASLREAAARQGVSLEIELSDSLRPLHADRAQVEVVLRNLVANAIEAAAEGREPRRVWLRARDAGAGVARVEVEDTGFGVDAARAERIFEPLESGRASGMGMGLAIARAIAEAHGGRLWAVPGPKGLFCLTLPTVEGSHG